MLYILVNSAFISETLAPLIGGADSEQSLINFTWCDVNNESDVKKLTNETLLPIFSTLPFEFQTKVKDSLAYYLYNSKINFEKEFNSLLLPFDTPRDTKLFFKWIWEVLFQENKIEYIKCFEVVENFDINEPINLLIEIRNESNTI